MFLRVILCAALALAVDGQRLANGFMDKLLQHVYNEATRLRLDPLEVPSFQIKVDSTGITNRNMKANFTNGSVWGLFELSREGHCTHENGDGELTIYCFLSLRNVDTLMKAEVKGDRLIGPPHNVSTFSTFSDDSRFVVKIVGGRLEAARTLDLVLYHFKMATSVIDGNLELAFDRLDSFEHQLHIKLANAIKDVVLKNVYVIMRNALALHRIPWI